MEHMTHQQKTFEVKEGREYDIIVVGGGTTGISAAVAAARDGAKVCIIEYYGFLGGNATTGLPWMAYHNLNGQRVVGGVAYEFIERLWEVGGASDFYMDPVCSSTIAVNPHWWKIISMREVKKAGARMVKGRAGDHKTQVASYTITLSGVEVEPLLDYFR